MLARLDMLPPRDDQFAMVALVHQLCTGVPVMLFVIWRTSQVPRGLYQVGLLTDRPLRHVLVGLLGLVVIVPLLLGVGTLTVAAGLLVGQSPPAIGHELLQALVNADSPATVAMVTISAVLVAPIFEEVMFRGLVQTSLAAFDRHGRRWRLVLISACVFTLVHQGMPWQTLPVIFVLAVGLGWLYERTGSLLPSIIVHAGFNALNVAAAMSTTLPPEP